ncbi:hypothetical protein ACUB14_001580 [Pseudomonas aeruginosa]|uniref:Uncharacterized protein n=1 Tax=Pseudomonas putida TaxID=303 RepID=A0AAW4BQZ6_PSEPU|nr:MULTISPECIES: hypothetical protein [Pseudomonas]EKD1543836.1 hypothetical protein [Pseudomonas aeruginosa]EKV8096496.1 hypothetical protein [Pseudomonas aeruginosa]EKW6729898.1 hypothetical protein [Pseudomonas aeruginosa]ELC8336876.1 hypothetical protein [Pseudomonas aeruginosa]ELD6232342.1 hypothetical protein [Pseudomonas aeruginosa]
MILEHLMKLALTMFSIAIIGHFACQSESLWVRSLTIIPAVVWFAWAMTMHLKKDRSIEKTKAARKALAARNGA